MGFVDFRLQKVMQMTREGIAIPIIVETINKPGSSDISELSQFMYVSRISSFINQVYGTAYFDGIQNLSYLSFVTRIYYDEPVNRFFHNLPRSASLSVEDNHVTTSEVSKHVNAKELNDEEITGKGIKIAIIDTGVNKDHIQMKGAVIKSVNIAKKYSDNARDGDQEGHGQHVATIAAGREVTIYSKNLEKEVTLRGIAPEANIISIKVLDDDGVGQTSWVLEGIEEAVNAGANIINMSLGSMFDGAGISPDSKLVNDITFNKGILCCVAAGNSFFNFTLGSPGGAIGAITVASNSIRKPFTGIVSTFSSKGTTTDGRVKPDISAPGGNFTDIKEVIFSGTSGHLEKEAGEPYIGLMGTSMSCPVVSGSLALLLSSGMKPDRFYVEDLLACSTKYSRPKDINMGWGQIDVKKAYDRVIRNESLFPISSIMRFADELSKPISVIVPKFEDNMYGIRLPYSR